MLMRVLFCLLFSSYVSYSGVMATPNQITPEVPFYDQKDNREEGWRACNITSIAMVLDYFGITDPKISGVRTPDLIYDQFGIVQDPKDLRDLFNKVAQESGSNIRDKLYMDGTFEQLREQAKKGIPTIVHGWFTESGHIMVVTGFDGENYVVHDPYGKWNGEKWQPTEQSYDKSVSGKGLKYPAAEFESAINDNGKGNDLWLHTFITVD